MCKRDCGKAHHLVCCWDGRVHALHMEVVARSACRSRLGTLERVGDVLLRFPTSCCSEQKVFSLHSRRWEVDLRETCCNSCVNVVRCAGPSLVWPLNKRSARRACSSLEPYPTRARRQVKSRVGHGFCTSERTCWCWLSMHVRHQGSCFCGINYENPEETQQTLIQCLTRNSDDSQNPH